MSDHITRDELNTHHERLIEAMNRGFDGITSRLDRQNDRLLKSETKIAVLDDRSNRAERESSKRGGVWGGIVSLIVSGLAALAGAQK